MVMPTALLFHILLITDLIVISLVSLYLPSFMEQKMKVNRDLELVPQENLCWKMVE